MNNRLWFHAATAGECNLEIQGETRHLFAGDLVVIPHGSGHKARGNHSAPTPLVFDLPHEFFSDSYAVLRHGGGGDRAHLVGGGIRFDHPGAQHLITALPPLIHIEAAQSTRSDWLRATLAEEVGMSRSALAARFSELVGESAIRYLTRWRMHVALDRMQKTNDNLATTAAHVGYESEAASSRAFKRVMGTSPRSARAALG